MGKKIDIFVLSALSAAGLYLYFFRKCENHAAAIALAFVSFLLIAKLIRRISARLQKTSLLQRRRIRRLSGGTIMRLACMEPDEARASVACLLEKCYEKSFPVELVQQMPAGKLSPECVFELWKRHRGEEKLVVCATCRCEGELRAMCAELKQPRVALLDAGALTALIAEHPEGIYVEGKPAPRRRLRLKRLGTLLFNRKNAPRCLLFSAAMLVMYIFSARKSYLIASMLLVFLALTALKQVRRPAKLF